MICYNCGNEINTVGTNCPFCGALLNAAQGYAQGPGYSQAQPGNGQAPNQFQQMEQSFDQRYNQGYSQPAGSSLAPSTAAIICYLTWIGLLVAVIASDKNDPFLKHHLNNAIILMISSVVVGIVAVIPFIGWIVSIAGEIFVFVCFIMGIIGAINGEYKELPLIGQFKILK